MNRRGSERFEPGSGGGDRFRAMLSRVFGDAENPLQWAVTVGRIAGIRVRIHVVFILYAVAQLVVALLARDAMGPAFVGIGLAWLFALVLLHEFGHCFACRAVGGEADDILMWPLGGLATVYPPETPRAHLVTTLGGPAVHVVLLPVFAAVMLAMGIGDRVLFNPLSLPLGGLTWVEVAIFLGHAANLLLLAFNVLLPIFPLDGGRVLHAALWKRMGRRPAMDLTLRVGFVGAIALGVFALVANQTLLLGVAVFAGISCFLERRTLRASDDLTSPWAESAQWREGDDEPTPQRPSKREAKRRDQEQREQEELDGVLARIAASGMDSLSKAERRILERATKKRRDG